MGVFAAPDGRVRAGWRVAFFGLAATAAGLLISGIAYGLIELTPLVGFARQYGLPLSAYGDLLAFAIGTYATIRIVDGARTGVWSRVGLGRAGLRGRALAIGLAAGTLGILVPCLLLLLAGPLTMARQAPDSETWWTASRTALLLLAPAALEEELAIRGYLLTTLVESIGARGAVLSTSALFAALHLLNPGPTVISTLMVGLAGVLLATIRLKTGSLWAAAVAHLAWNLVQAVALHAPVSGLPLPTPGYRLVDNGPAWLTGGTWGPEGGLAAAGGMLVATFLVLRLQPRFEPRTELETP